MKSLRQRTEIPIVLMLYYNSIHAMGYEPFCNAATAAGVDGLIVPDMPPDEAGPLKKPADAAVEKWGQAGLLRAVSRNGDRLNL